MTEHQPSAADEAPDGTGDGRRPVDERCPSCGALRPPEVAWCTQCYARFDVPGDAADATSPEDDGAGPEVGVPEVDGAVVVPAGDLGPAHREGAGPTVPPEELEARAQEMLARLSAERDEDERVRSWSGRLTGRGPKVVAIVVGTLVLTGLLFAGMAVLGALL